MNDLNRVIRDAISTLEAAAGLAGEERLFFHLMPLTGWLNDPNGLCFFQGEYHVYFQYSPFDVNGGLKVWGHYKSRELLHWDYCEPAIVPDSPYDCHGVYSGTAFTDDEGLHLFYTGNVKYDGDYDYITAGRGSNVLRVDSTDGSRYSEKKLLLTNDDYPADCTCHVRDPKVFEKGGSIYLFLGARKQTGEGAVLVYKSDSLDNFRQCGEITHTGQLGYMWECPDYLELQGKAYLAISPQGMKAEDYRYHNIYQSGYCLLEKEADHFSIQGDFTEWDYGFDFYAPQVFRDGSGRMILIAWMGMPDAPYGNHTIQSGWQHTLTVPRELCRLDGLIAQYPVQEIEQLRGTAIPVAGGEWNQASPAFDLCIDGITGDDWEFRLQGGFTLVKRGEVCTLAVDERAGDGRTVRTFLVGQIDTLRILGDVSAFEVYLAEGRYVCSFRCYPESDDRHLLFQGYFGSGTLYDMGRISVNRGR